MFKGQFGEYARKCLGSKLKRDLPELMSIHPKNFSAVITTVKLAVPHRYLSPACTPAERMPLFQCPLFVVGNTGAATGCRSGYGLVFAASKSDRLKEKKNKRTAIRISFLSKRYTQIQNNTQRYLGKL